MSDVSGQERTQERVRGLCRQLLRALDESTPSRSMEESREMAQLLSLRGLDRMLMALAPYANGPWPAPLRPILDRLQRAVAESICDGHVEAFRRMDEELGLMARAIERVPLGARPAATGRPGPTAEPAPVLLSEALEGIPGERTSTELLRRVRLRPSVAGALRAALDWLVGGNPARMRMWLASDGSALDVTCEGIAHSGLQAAAEVLTSVGAHLGPTGERPGAWTIRVPIRAERETFLMLEQDELQLAVPWHAVVRVRLIPADTIDAMLNRQGLPVLPPIASMTRRAAEQPVVVVALGLRRACLVADRLVWRMSAEPTETPAGSPHPGIVRAVRSDDDEVHWVLEPEWLLRAIAPPPTAQSGPRPSAPPAPPAPPAPISAPPVAPHAPASAAPPAPMPVSGGADASRAADESTPRSPEPMAELGPEHVEPLAGPDAGTPSTAVVAEPQTAAAPEPPRAPPPATSPVAAAARVAGPRRALIAEDSIAARIFLVRLLEEQGFEVHAVPGARELRAALGHGPWTLVCADGELPDAAGEEFLPGLARAAAAAGSPLVVLVRDAADESAARAAGVAVTLRKPFGRAALERLLERVTGDGGGGGADGTDPDPREWGAR